MAPLALVANLTTRWRTCISCTFDQPPGRTSCIATLPWIALLTLSISIDLVSSSARVTSVKSTQVAHLETPGPKDRTPDTWV